MRGGENSQELPSPIWHHSVKMAVWRKFGSLTNSLLKKNAPVLCINRSYALEFDEYLQKLKPIPLRAKMPGPYPTTEEERLKAAEKYNMHPDEYVPLPPDERGAGDYPDLPAIGVEARDPYYPWDFPALRRNFGEPMHRQFDFMVEERYEYGVRQKVPHLKGSIIFITFFLSCYGFHLLFWDTKPDMTEKQYPGKGVHYIFEPAK